MEWRRREVLVNAIQSTTNGFWDGEREGGNGGGGAGGAGGARRGRYLVLQLLTPFLRAPVLGQQLCVLRVLGNPSLQGGCDAASWRVHL